MKTDKISLLKEILVTQMNHWAFLPFYLFAVVLIQNITGKGAVHLTLWGLFGCIPLLLYFSRKYVHRAFVLFATHIGGVAALFFLPVSHVLLRILNVAIGVIYAVYSLFLWAKTEDKQDIKLYPLLSAGISLLMTLFMNRLGCKTWDNTCMIALILVVGLYFLIYYMEQYLHFLVVNHSSASHIPAREMFRSGLGMVSIYTLLGVIVLFFTTHMTWMKGFFNLIKNALFSVLRFFFQLLPRQEQVPEETTSVEENMQAMMEMNDVHLSGETGWFWNVLEYVMYIALAIALAYVAVMLLIKLYCFVQKQMRQTIVKKEETEEEVFDVHEKIVLSTKRKTPLSNPFEQLEPAARIRRMYRKKLLTSENLLVREHNTEQLGRLTARECEKILDAKEMASVYEKARYSQAECNGEDVKRMRKACKA